MEGRVRVPIPAAVQPVSGGLAGRCLDRRDPGQLGERRLRAQAPGVVPRREQQRTGGVRAGAEDAEQRGLALVVSRRSSLSSSRTSALRAWCLRARDRSAIFVAPTGSLGTPGRRQAQVRTSLGPGSPRRSARSSSGAVTTRACRALMACVRARFAVDRATRSARIISTVASLALGVPDASPESTAEAAASASAGSDLPRRLLAWRLGRITSITTSPWARRCRAGTVALSEVRA
jgi:hypothetical protein